MAIDISDMTWLNPPPESRAAGGRLIGRSGFETDFWQNTYYGFQRDSGHFLHLRRQAISPPKHPLSEIIRRFTTRRG
jgi:regulation of enolase protein 1 (concanavalin A-like superfamily)